MRRAARIVAIAAAIIVFLALAVFLALFVFLAFAAVVAFAMPDAAPANPPPQCSRPTADMREAPP